jgi:hypothetical protein
MTYKAGIGGLGEPALVTDKSPLIIQIQTNADELSPLFRDPTIAEGEAIPGLQAYSDALDKYPITMKALTSLVGWFLADLIAQVSLKCNNNTITLSNICFFPNPNPNHPIRYLSHLPLSLGLHCRRTH